MKRGWLSFPPAEGGELGLAEGPGQLSGVP